MSHTLFFVKYVNDCYNNDGYINIFYLLFSSKNTTERKINK